MVSWVRREISGEENTNLCSLMERARYKYVVINQSSPMGPEIQIRGFINTSMRHPPFKEMQRRAAVSRAQRDQLCWIRNCTVKYYSTSSHIVRSGRLAGLLGLLSVVTDSQLLAGCVEVDGRPYMTIGKPH